MMPAAEASDEIRSNLAIALDVDDVVVDLKLHDIPTTVEKSAVVLGALGARYASLHAHGGSVMLRAGVEGLARGAADAGLPTPVALAVTILTSDAGAPPHILGQRVKTALEAGCGGIVCAAGDIKEAHTLAPRLKIVVPGIRPEGSPPRRRPGQGGAGDRRLARFLVPPHRLGALLELGHEGRQARRDRGIGGVECLRIAAPGHCDLVLLAVAHLIV